MDDANLCELDTELPRDGVPLSWIECRADHSDVSGRRDIEGSTASEKL